MYQVRDLMTADVVTLRETDDLGMVDQIFRMGRIRHLPVTDRTGHLKGLVTHRDLLRACGHDGRNRNTPAGSVMTRQLMTVMPDTPLRQALRMMVRNKFGCLPVVDADNRVVGILTESDLVKFAAEVIGDLDILNREVRDDAEP